MGDFILLAKRGTQLFSNAQSKSYLACVLQKKDKKYTPTKFTCMITNVENELNI